MEVFFVDDPSTKHREKARSFVAKNAIRRRVKEQEAAKNGSVKSTWTVDRPRNKPKHHVSREETPELSLQLLRQLPVSLSNDVAINNNNAPRKMRGIWGVSNTICPNPGQAAHSAFRTSNVAPFIQAATNMFNKAKFGKFNSPEEQNKLHIMALTYRGEAMKIARQQLSITTKDSGQGTDLTHTRQRDLRAESHFLIILQLVLMDYTFFPTQARAHFAASREFIRSWAADSQGTSDPISRIPTFIHNHSITQIAVAFDNAHLGPDSLIWDRSDLPELQKTLQRFVARLSEAGSLTTNTIYKRRIDPGSLIWQCLTKTPGSILYDRGNYLSESQGQMAAIMLICSIFMDYDPASSIPQQCLSDLESAMISVGDEALVSVLNLAWMMAGGIGLPIENRRQRLYAISGMLYVFRRQQHPLDNDADLSNRVDNQCEFTEDEFLPLTLPAQRLQDTGVHLNLTMSSLLPPGYRKFSERILIWDPQQKIQSDHESDISKKSESSNSISPDVVLIFTWADAQQRHYVKYIEGYQNLYPNAKIILTTATTIGTFFGGQKAAQTVVHDMVHKELVPLYRSGLQSTDSPTSRPRVLAHAFSNSGGLNLEATWSVWKEVHGSATPIPLTALILDSTPGGLTYKTEFSRWTTGVSLGMAGLPQPLRWAIAAIIVTCLMVVPQVLGIEIMATRGPRELNLARNIPHETARLYIYSSSDKLIHWKDVEKHAEDARNKGYANILLERFDGSSHVSHLRLDPSRYWNAVWKVWNAACRT
uniref:Transmembrane protein 53 n=1 Tax=Talaromyces marneffei PM1 TaxID=1077442 RepID=A0A093VFP9_TALMA